MDIIDIILARAKSFTGETATLTRQAQEAMSNANSIVDSLQAIEEEAQSASELASAASAAATLAAEQFDEMKEDIDAAAAELVDSHIQQALSLIESRTESLEEQIQNAGGTITFSDNNTSAAKIKQATVTKNGVTNTYIVEKNYTSYGNNEDGSMTQKAIKNYVETAVKNAGGSGTSNLGDNNAGSVVIVGPDGNIIAGDTSEQDIIELLIRTGIYQAKDAVGASIDYENRSIGREQEATGHTDFSKYSMYGGRKRCTVADDGSIIAFYGDANYVEDGSNGQVMIYQPKFYYQRVPINTTNGEVGKIIRKESLIISPAEQSGFKLHPAFIDENGETLEYILLSAYEGCVYDTSSQSYNKTDSAGIDFQNDKLSSISGAKPTSGERNSFNIVNAEQLARNRGEGWHISNLKACSVDQMLALIEFGTLNIQDAIEVGVSNLENSYATNRACITGSTSALGNLTGTASKSSNLVNGTTNTYGEAGKRSISYRGEENPFGNIWRFVGGVNVFGDSTLRGGIPYICTNYNYSSTITEDYESAGFCLPTSSEWISGMGYGDEKYDWVIMPAEASGANSAMPVGDYVWVTSNLNEVHCVAIGGNWLFGQKNGMFYYAADKNLNYSAATFGTRLMFIPTKNTIHDNNYTLWLSKMGG